MDSIKEIIGKAQQKMTSFPTSSDNRKPCKHGTMCMVDDDGFLCTWECSKCCAEKEQADRERRSRDQEASIFRSTMSKPWKNYIFIPKRFSQKSIDSFEASTAQQKRAKTVCSGYLKNFDKVFDNGTSMILCGKPGTGKTHLAYAIASELHKRYVSAAVTTAADMTGAVKTAYKTDKPVSEFIDAFASFKLLIIDEVGVQVDSDSEKRIFFDIINKRYEEMRPTIMLSNLSLEELTAFIGDRIVDRMKENNGVVMAFDWDSYRK